MPLRLLVGLGNPGATYDGTRHNLGAAFVTALATQHRVTLRSQPRFKGQLGQLRVDKHELLLFIPTTFMNESGQAVAPLLRYHRLPIADMLVAHDELDLPPGAARLKRGGGAAGHNGLRDLIRALGGCADFARLRLGIGHPGHRSAVTRYVLDGHRAQSENFARWHWSLPPPYCPCYCTTIGGAPPPNYTRPLAQQPTVATLRTLTKIHAVMPTAKYR